MDDAASVAQPTASSSAVTGNNAKNYSFGGINIPWLRPYRNTRCLSSASASSPSSSSCWSPHNVLAVIAGESLYLVYCSSSNANIMSPQYEITDRKDSGAVPLDFRWHPRLAPNTFPAQAALAILHSDGVVTIHYVDLEATSKISVELVSTITPGEILDMQPEQHQNQAAAVSSNNDNNQDGASTTTTTTTTATQKGSKNNKNEKPPNQRVYVPYTSAMEWLPSAAETKSWARLALFGSTQFGAQTTFADDGILQHKKVLFVEFIRPESGVGQHKCEVVPSRIFATKQQIHLSFAFRPIFSSLLTFPKPQHFQNNSRDIESVIAVTCAASNSIFLFAETFVPFIGERTLIKNTPELITKIDLTKEFGFPVSVLNAVSISSTSWVPSSATGSNIKRIHQHRDPQEIGNYFTICAVAPGNVIAVTFVILRQPPGEVSHLAYATLTEYLHANVLKVAIHRSKTPPFVALPCPTSSSTTIPMDLSNLICVGPVFTSYNDPTIGLHVSAMRFHAFSFTEVVEIDVPFLDSEELMLRASGFEQNLASKEEEHALSVRVLASSETDAQIEMGTSKFFRMLLGSAIHSSGEFAAFVIRGMGTSGAKASTWLVVASLGTFVAAPALQNISRKKFAALFNPQSSSNEKEDAAWKRYKRQFEQFLEILQNSIFSTKRKQLSQSSASTPIPNCITKIHQLLSFFGNDTWPLPQLIETTGIAPTISLGERALQRNLWRSVIDLISWQNQQQQEEEQRESGQRRQRNGQEEGEEEEDAKNEQNQKPEQQDENLFEFDQRLLDTFAADSAPVVLSLFNEFVQGLSTLDSGYEIAQQQQQKISLLFRAKCYGRPILLAAFYFLQKSQHFEIILQAYPQKAQNFKNRLLNELILPHCCGLIASSSLWKQQQTQQQNLTAVGPSTSSSSSSSSAPSKLSVIRALLWLRLFCREYESCKPTFCKNLIEQAESIVARNLQILVSADGSKEFLEKCPICHEKESIGVSLNLAEGTTCLKTANQQQQDHIAMLSPTSFRAVLPSGSDEDCGDDGVSPNLVATKCVVCGCAEQLNEFNQRALCMVCGGLLSA